MRLMFASVSEVAMLVKNPFIQISLTQCFDPKKHTCWAVSMKCHMSCHTQLIFKLSSMEMYFKKKYKTNWIYCTYSSLWNSQSLKQTQIKSADSLSLPFFWLNDGKTQFCSPGNRSYYTLIFVFEPNDCLNTHRRSQNNIKTNKTGMTGGQWTATTRYHQAGVGCGRA